MEQGGLPANVGCCLHQGLGAQHGFRTPLYYQVLNFGMIVSLALMIWKRLMLITGSQSPIVVVLSGSTGPAFHRRDLFLTNQVEDPTRLGETGVFRIEEREISIVRGVLKTHAKQNGYIKFLTKGDNTVDDCDVMGRVREFVPFTGIVLILTNDYPKFKSMVCISFCFHARMCMDR
uniref:Uncharacterized protein n=1 Tax=Canis lupus familiaris TaxID=9615 RepID=A0A8P0T7J9_CANLF